jgi:outer membrane lipoprotein SlyB
MLKQSLIALAGTGALLAAAPAEARDRTYDSQGRYIQPRAVSAGEVWQGRDGRYYCRRGNGTTGLVIGAAGGALIGRAIDGGRNRTTGTILGAAAGALLGREVQRNMRCR